MSDNTIIHLNDPIMRYAMLFYCVLALPLKLLVDLVYYTKYTGTINVSYLLLILLPAIFLHSLNNKSNIIHNLFYIIVFYSLIRALFSIIYYGDAIPITIAITYLGTSIVLYCLYYLVGYSLRYVNDTLSRVNLLAIIASTGYIAISEIVLKKPVWQLLNESGAYLRIADTYAICALMCLYYYRKNITVYILILFASFYSIYCLGSRSTIIMFIVSIGLTELITTRRKLAASFIALLLLLISFVYADEIISFTDIQIEKHVSGTNRIISTIVDSSDFGGVSSRKEYLQKGIERIYSAPIWGSFMGDVHEYSMPGKYIHNILYLWDEYGILTFGIVLILVGYVINLFTRADISDYPKSILPLFIFSLSSMLVARSFQFPYLFIVIGLLSTVTAVRNKQAIC